MHKDDFTSGIERVEKLFGQEQNVYDEAKLTEIYDVVRHLDAEQWDNVVGGVVRTWGYKTLPNISAFEKLKNELGRSGHQTRKIHEDCPTCSGHGRRAFIYRRDERFVEGICLCDCPNAENFTAPPHMTIQQARRLPGFQAADRPGAVPHMLEALNPPAARQDTPVKKTSPGSEKSPASSTQPASPPGSKTSETPGTLSEAAAQLAGKLDGSQNPREHDQEAAQDQKAANMKQALNDWLSDDEKAHTPF